MVVVGVDEVGRGPLAGPVTVCAVVLKKKLPRGFFAGIRNSKALSENARTRWFGKARAARRAGLIDFATASLGARFIDERGIISALRAAISRALTRLKLIPRASRILLDGSIRAPSRFYFQKTITRGDEKTPVIALASIIAKVRRDRHMRRCAQKFPAYGFEKHVGYGTAGHYRSIKRNGLCILHRRSFLKNLPRTTSN